MRSLALPLALAFIVFTIPVSAAHAVWVNGHFRSNGTYVQGYERTAPDGNPYNNYSYPGNYNPNTGSITGGDPTTYLNNYYGTSGGGYVPTYTAPSTPSCPLLSYWNGSSCTCDSGFVAQTDTFGNQSCVSGYTKCSELMGSGSTYNSLNNTCSCMSGYLQSGGKCVSQITYCTNLMGVMSTYNSLTGTCQCMSGYTFNGSSCVYNSPTYSSTYTSTYTPTYSNTCPINSYQSPTDSTQCLCNTGYQPNSAKNGCELIPSPVSTKTFSNGLTSTQVNSIIALLQSFGADAKVVANVAVILEK